MDNEGGAFRNDKALYRPILQVADLASTDRGLFGRAMFVGVRTRLERR